MIQIYNINRRLQRLLCLVVLLLGGLGSLWGQDYLPQADEQELWHKSPLPYRLTSEAKVSILVVDPSPEAIYTLYGHAGLRISDSAQGLDVVFNYGLFEFDNDFIYKFVKGQTDYFCAPERAESFIYSYTSRGSRVRELELTLPPDVLPILWQKALMSISPEHRVYRYNFFRDNCSTRPLELVLTASSEVSGLGARRLEIQFSHADRYTWRSEINALEAPFPWVKLGTDLALGAPTDEGIDSYSATFLPHRIAPFLSSGVAWVSPDGVRTPMLADQRIYEPMPSESATQVEGGRQWLTHPTTIFSLLLVFSLLVSFRFTRFHLAVEMLIFIGAAGASFVLFYISVLSEHPSVWPNYNLIVLHPLHILRPMLVGYRAGRWVLYYHFVNFVLQVGFWFWAWLLPQAFNPCIYLISATLLVLSLGHLRQGGYGNAVEDDDPIEEDDELIDGAA